MKKFLVLIFLLIVSCSFHKKNPVIIISIDNLSPEYLKKMSELLNFSKEGIIYENAISPYPACLSGNLSILTDRTPLEAQAFLNEFYYLKENIKTLPEILKENGYKTFGFISGMPLKKIKGIDKGFDYYNDKFLQIKDGNLLLAFSEREIFLNYRKCEDTLVLALNKIKDEKNKFFLFVHLYDAFPPFLPPEDFISKYPSDPYLASLSYIDFQLGKFFEELKKQKKYDNSMIIITSDHSRDFKAEFKEAQNNVKIPLIIKYPKNSNFEKNDLKIPITLNKISDKVLSFLKIKNEKKGEKIYSFNLIPFHIYGKEPEFSIIENDLIFDYRNGLRVINLSDLKEKNDIKFNEKEIIQKFEEVFGDTFKSFKNFKSDETFYPSILEMQEKLKLGDFKFALKLLNKYYDKYNKCYAFLRTLLDTKKIERDFKGIEETIKIFEENFGSSPELDFEKYNILLITGKREKAKEYLYQMMKKYKPFYFLIEEALSFEIIKDKSTFENFTKNLPENYDEYVKNTFNGIFNLFDKNEEEAKKFLNNAIKEGAEFPIPYFQMGLILKREGKIKDAIPYLYSAYVLSQKNPRFSYELGDCYAILGDIEKSYNFFKKTYEIDKNNFSANVSLLKISFILIQNLEKEKKLNLKAEVIVEFNSVKENVLKNFKKELNDLIEKDSLLKEIILKNS